MMRSTPRQRALGHLIIGQTLKVAIKHPGAHRWSRPIKCGDVWHRKSAPSFSKHHRPGDAHVHFFGTDGLSFGENIFLQEDVMEIHWEGMRRPMQNRVKILEKNHSLPKVKVLD